MKLELKYAITFGVVTFATLAALGVDPVAVVVATVVTSFIGWHVGCALAPDDVTPSVTRISDFQRWSDGTYDSTGHRDDHRGDHQDDI